MTVNLALAIASNFRHYGVAATYTPAVGAAVAVRVITTRGATESAGMTRSGFRVASEDQSGALIADLRKSEVAAPKAGDSLTIAGTVYPIKGEPLLDSEGLVWRITLGKGV